MKTYRLLTLPAAILITALEVVFFTAVSTTAPAETPQVGQTANTATTTDRDTTGTAIAP